jgi:hypothetical protein
MDGFEATTYITPVQYGSTATSSNNGDPKPSGFEGTKFGNPIPETPSWPIKNPSAFPKNGGATSSN